MLTDSLVMDSDSPISMDSSRIMVSINLALPLPGRRSGLKTTGEQEFPYPPHAAFWFNFLGRLNRRVLMG